MSRNVLWLAVVPALLLCGVGCGGISSSGSISPASFFLPGLMQNKDKTEEVAPLASAPPLENTVSTAQSL